VRAALAAVDPATAVKRVLHRDGDHLAVADLSCDLTKMRHLIVIGAGKASAAMAQGVEAVLGDRVAAGIVNVKDGCAVPLSKIEVNEAGHPSPDQRGLLGTQQMLAQLDNLTCDDLVLCLISGGGSALLEAPMPDITLDDLAALTQQLLACGATINEINAVRKHLSQVKGGGLARRAQPAPLIALILSDVVGSPLDTIASGPTAPDPTTFADAYAVLERYDPLTTAPPAIVQHLRAGCAGRWPETPKPGDPLFADVHNVIVASNEMAAHAAVERARNLGLDAALLSTYVEGEAREIGIVCGALAQEMLHSGQPLSPPACLVAGGETTVTLRPNSELVLNVVVKGQALRGHGSGGRNQELALAAALKIDGWDDAMIVTLATDGSDGPTDAAGAFAFGSTVARARALGLDPRAYLANNDSYHFFAALGDLLVTGPTRTNVNDLIFIFAF
jgi:hydroxypyruvate reductase